MLKSNCCHFAVALASVGFSLPHVAWKPIFDTGMLNRLTSEIRITLPFSTASIDSMRPAKPTEPLFKMKYCVCAGLNSVKTNSSCLFLTAFTMLASVFVLFVMLFCCFSNSSILWLYCSCCFSSASILLFATLAVWLNHRSGSLSQYNHSLLMYRMTILLTRLKVFFYVHRMNSFS